MGTYNYMEVLVEILKLSRVQNILTLTNIAEGLEISQSSLRHHIRKLFKFEYIEFGINKYDNRAKPIKITQNGKYGILGYLNEYEGDFESGAENDPRKVYQKYRALALLNEDRLPLSLDKYIDQLILTSLN